MGIEFLEIGVKMRKFVIFTIRWCFRSICNHPFLVGLLCFLIFLYRLSPFMFSLLVSASPILVCTAVLLGVLLSYGQPNIPEIEIEIEEKTTFESVSIKTGLSSGDNAVIDKNESYYVERFSEEGRDEEEQLIERSDLSVIDNAPLMEDESQEFELKEGEIWDKDRELGGLRYNNKQKNEWIEERLDDVEAREKNHYALAAKVNDGLLESDDEKSEADSFDSEKVNVDSLDSPPRSPWKRLEERENEDEEEEEEEEEDEDDDDDEEEEEEEEDEDEDDASVSGSDGVESSSPDASMADIIPMLDELHPLLDEEAPQPVHMSRGASDANLSEKSLKSSTSSREDDENLEGADDENEDAQDDKEEQTKSVITWTEEDQKNLMDLGSSEIERNQRLENLILRRRARKKNMSTLAERNLIDFESSDLPFNIAPISTRRHNPFDLPIDSYDNNNLGLPPIPGSAPSILLPRRNPFDIPYDSSEEKPNLMGDGFQEEFTSQSREPFFRRHESFNVRPSIFAPNRQDFRMRPYFVAEGSVSEESGFSPFRRQSSEVSESKVSSVLESESIGSVADLEDRKFPEEDSIMEVEAITSTNEVSEEDVHGEPELISKIECVSLELGQGEKRDAEVSELEFQVDVADHSRSSTENHSNYEGVGHSLSRDSSSSSLSEVSERVFTVTEGEGLSMFEDGGDVVVEERGITSVEADFGSTSTLVQDLPPREPVYDSSPRGLRNTVSSSSINSDLNPESESSIAHQADESRPIDVVNIREHENVNADLSGVDEALVEENLIEQHKCGEVIGSRADKNSHTLFESSENENLDKSLEEKYLMTEKESLIEVSELPVEGETREEYIVGVEETVQSPISDADVCHEAEEKVISTHDKPIFKHLNEVPEPSEDVLTSPKLNMHDVQDLDNDISSNVNSPLSPESIPVPTSATETTSSRADVQTVIEEEVEMKEIDEELLSELDYVGDFNVNQWGSGSNEFVKNTDSVNSVEENKIKYALRSENSREDIDEYEENVECISDPQTPKASKVGHIDGGQDSSDQETSEDKALPKENEVKPEQSVVNHSSREDSISVMPELNVGPTKDVDSVFEKAELTSIETEILVGDAETSHQDQVDTNRASKLHVKEPIPSEDTNSPPKQVCDGKKLEEKPDHEGKEPEDLHATTSGKGKGKMSKSSSSSSSSSSESSSSDSDRE